MKASVYQTRGDGCHDRCGTTLIMFAMYILTVAFSQTANGQINPKRQTAANERIDSLRKGPLRILVLDREGDPVPDCPVTVTMMEHAFPFGVRLSKKAIEQSPSLESHKSTPVWRAFTALSLDAVSSWAKTQPGKGKWDFKDVDAIVLWAKQRKLSLTWGGLISADRGRLPGWAGDLSASALKDAIDAHAGRVLDNYGHAVSHVFPHTHTLDHRYITQELGVGMQRHLYHTTHQHNVNATAMFGDAFRADRLTGMIRSITKMREQLIPFDSIAVGTKLRGSANSQRIMRSLKAMNNLGLKIVINNLEIDGNDEVESARNVEVALHTLFADPSVEGIYWPGLFPLEMNNPITSLLDENGKPTPAGLIVDHYITDIWWTRISEKTDELGNWRGRVFAGQHQLLAKLPDGSVITSSMRIRAGDKEQLTVLQPVGPKQPPQQVTDADEE